MFLLHKNGNILLKGQHIELGIAENNLFLLLGALGISENIFGTSLLPIGTIYDTFIGRGLRCTKLCYIY